MNPSGRQGIKDIALKSGKSGAVGAVYSQTLSERGGRSIAGDYQITEAVPGKLLRFHVVAGPARPAGEYWLQDIEAGTELRFTLDVQPKGFMKLLAPMIAKTMATEVAQLTALKRVLEAS
ncbi:hypothetical protein [Arthrobacter sp. H14-L1]|uniref:hypothetical protein n=1 Tax=Arthrobacter sp. H14-L1 TaxID=2996697 RepID=UPI00226FE3A4|nr:hypothetical protein [Arthrobacter sp. H14-L1]MCY0905981.1 hypothetical protein [Arthrobacter sp. H14-L1]